VRAQVKARAQTSHSRQSCAAIAEGVRITGPVTVSHEAFDLNLGREMVLN
jgi:hypothetical protein